MIHVSIIDLFCWPWLLQKYGCSWHTEWFETLNRHTFNQRLPTPLGLPHLSPMLLADNNSSNVNDKPQKCEADAHEYW